MTASELKKQLKEQGFNTNVKTGKGSMKGLLLVFFKDKITSGHWILSDFGLMLVHTSYAIKHSWN